MGNLQYPGIEFFGRNSSMPRFKRIDTGLKLLPIALYRQLLPGTFEHALSYLVDHELDLRVLGKYFRDEASDAQAHLNQIRLLPYCRNIHHCTK